MSSEATDQAHMDAATIVASWRWDGQPRWRWPDWVKGNGGDFFLGVAQVIETAEGDMHIERGHWITLRANGDLRPLWPGEFLMVSGATQ